MTPINFSKVSILCIIFLFHACKKATQESEISNPKPNSSEPIMHTFLINGNKTIIKEEDGIYYYADDIILSKKQFNILKRQSNSNISATERSTIINSLTKLWPSGDVPYVYDSTFGGASMAKTCMDHISYYVPGVKFIPRTTESNYISYRNGSGNNSYLGMVGGMQYVTLSEYNSGPIVCHEILHALGIHHEQCRPDRDKFVTIHYENILAGKTHNFNIEYNFKGTSTFDFLSVMLYKQTAFSSNGQATITRNDGLTYTAERPHQAAYISPNDILGVSSLYPTLTDGDMYQISLALDRNKMLEYVNFENITQSLDSTLIIQPNNFATTAQKWRLKKVVDAPYWTIFSVNDVQRVITAKNLNDQAVLSVEDYDPTNKLQQFSITKYTDNTFTIKCREDETKCIDIPGSSTADGTRPVIYTFGNTTNQHFILEKRRWDDYIL